MGKIIIDRYILRILIMPDNDGTPKQDKIVSERVLTRFIVGMKIT